jgi:hypothetical protein
VALAMLDEFTLTHRRYCDRLWSWPQAQPL